MRKQICSMGLGAILAMGICIAAPAGQDNAAPQENAQAARPHMDPNRQLKRLTKQLNLTGDQQNQILPILKDRQQQGESIRSDSSLSAADRQAKMQALREDFDAKMKAVLNDDQKQKYDEMQKQMRERMQQRRERGNTPPAAAPSN